MRITTRKYSEAGGLTFYRMRLGDHAIELMATAKEMQVEGRRQVVARLLWRARAELRRAAAGA
jgi:hypothetical protein